MFKSILTVSLVVVSALAAAIPSPRALPSGTVTCGTAKYSVDQVSAAVTQGYKYKTAGTTVGSNSYPHKFNNYEGLELYCTGQTSWFEFPILVSHALYTGSSPGADRVVFAASGAYCATITHTGASGNNFVECDGD